MPNSPLDAPLRVESLNESKRFKSVNSMREQHVGNDFPSNRSLRGHAKTRSEPLIKMRMPSSEKSLPELPVSDETPRSIASILQHTQESQLEPADEKPQMVRTSSEIRASRFREAPMRDSPSSKPPSLFMRVMPRSKNQTLPSDPAAEEFMESYMEEQKSRPSLMQTARTASRATQLSGLTHHANTSISSNTTGTSGGDSAQNRESGIFKLGKSVKDAWNKVTFKSKDSKEDGAQSRDSELVQRQIRAEMEYATLKKRGHIGTFGSRASRTQSASFQSTTTGYMVDGPKAMDHRDSGIGLEALETRRSLDGRRMSNQAAPAPVVGQRTSTTPGKSISAKFHFRTPSLQDLKKIGSSTSLHRRTTSAANVLEDEIIITSTTTVESDKRPSTSAGFSSFVKSSRSKADLTKEEKLAKKVLELENKLTAAREQLEHTRSMDVLSVYDPMESGPKTRAAEPRPKSRARTEQKTLRFQPLPTLQSESLLVADNDELVSIQPGLKDSPDMPCASATALSSLAETPVQTPKRASDSWLQNATPVTDQPKSAFDSSSEDSPEGIFNAFRRHKSSPKADDSSQRKTPRRHRPRASLGLIDRSTISGPILPQQNSKESELARRSSLDTVSEEACILSSRRGYDSRIPVSKTQFAGYTSKAQSPKDSSPRVASPMQAKPRPKSSHHRHARSMSPIKDTFHTRPMTALPGLPSPSENQFQHYRSRSMTPPHPVNVNFSRPVTPGKLSSHSGGVDSTMNSGRRMQSSPHLSPSREDWEWPEDVF